MRDRAPRIALAATVLLAGCRHTSLLDQVDQVVSPPESYSFAEAFDPSGEAIEICTEVGGAQLQALQASLARSSFDLQAAFARLDAAEARAREAGAPLRPFVDAQLLATRGEQPAFGAGSGTAAGVGGETTTYQFSVAASYEIDVWGKLRDRRKAAVLDAEASAEDLRSLAISLSSLVAEAWFGIVAERELQALLASQIAISESFLELTELRFGQGLGPAQDIGRQRGQLLGLRGEVELSQGRLEALEAQLATLLGTGVPATPEPDEGLVELIAAARLPELGPPSALLQARPDLVAAQQRLAAADYRLAAQIKEWYPSLILTGSLFDLRTTISQLFEELFWQVSALVSETAYDGGRRQARIDQARAAAEESLYGYAQALVGAVGEVHNAIALDRAAADFLANLRLRLDEARRVLDLTRASYREGATDYLNVLTALLSQQSIEQQLVDARRVQLTNRVQLCRALGYPTGVELAPFLATGAAADRLAQSSPSSSATPSPAAE